MSFSFTFLSVPVIDVGSLFLHTESDVLNKSKPAAAFVSRPAKTLSCCSTANDWTVNQDNGLWAAPGLSSVHWMLNIRGFIGCLSLLMLHSVTLLP